MSSELLKRLVRLEEEKKIKDGVTHKLATAIIRTMEAAVGAAPPDPGEIVRLHHFSSPPALREDAKKP